MKKVKKKTTESVESGIEHQNTAKRRKTVADMSVKKRTDCSQLNKEDTNSNDLSNRQRGYERNDKNLTVQKVKEDYEAGEISAVLPHKEDPSFHVYETVQRLIRSGSGKIIPHFFRCSKCATIMNVNTSTHRPALERHFQKCTNKKKAACSKKEKEDNQISGDRIEVQRLITACVKISLEFPVDLTVIPLPLIFNEANCNDYINKLQHHATQCKQEKIGLTQLDEK